MKVTQQEFLDGLRGMPIVGSGTDGLQGTPTRTKGSRKSRGGNRDGWTEFDLKAAAYLGRSVSDMNAARESSRAFADALSMRTIDRMLDFDFIDEAERERLIHSMRARSAT